MKKWSIKGRIKSKTSLKLTIGMVVVLILGLITVNVIVNTVVRNTIYDNVLGIAQREQYIHAGEIDAWFGTVIKTLDNMARVLNVLPSEQYYKSIIEHFTYEYYFVDNIFIGFPDGRSINGLRWVPEEGWILSERPWYIAARAVGEGELAVLDPFWSHSGQAVVTALSKSLPNVGEEGAVLGFSVTLDEILTSVSRQSVMGDGHLILVGENGQIFAYTDCGYTIGPDMDIVDIRYDFDGGSYIMDSINAGNRFGRVGNSGIEPSYFIAAPMSNVNWNLIAIIPIEATEDIIASSLWTIMGSFFILLAVLAVIVVFFVSKLTKSEEVSRVKEQAANSAKSRFLSNMSHEIRTPMSAIIGMASIAKNTEDILKKDDCIDKIEKASRHLLGVVNQILDISKIEAERFTLDLHTFCFEKMIEEVISVLSFSIEEKGLDFDVSQDKKIPRHIISDEVRLAQVCANLLSNAVKFTPKGGKISLLTNFIESERNIRVEVADTGIGISKEQQFLLFNDFVQVESDASRRFAGTGLGLAISKRIVEMLGGSIWIESEPGKGSRFIFSIPAHIGDEESMSLQTGSNFTMSGRPEAKIGKGYTVLVVEDVDINREIAGNLLESTGIDIEYAFNGAQAVQMFGDKPESYDIIFMDIQMPGMDGIAATHLIRQLGTEKSKSIPIIAMTANVFREDVDRFIKAGMNDHLSKPLELSQIYTMLQKYFTKE